MLMFPGAACDGVSGSRMHFEEIEIGIANGNW